MQTACNAAIAALFAVVFAALTAGLAHAHAVLVASEPADGAMLAAPPARLTLTFNEPVTPLVLRLIGPDGAEQGIAVKPAGATLDVSPSGEIRHGTHLLSWRVVSADGHPVSGTIVFSLGHASEAGPPPPSANAAVGIAAWAARVAIYVAMFIGVGGAFFVSWCGGAPIYAVERVLYAILVTGLFVVPASVGLQGADLLGVSLAQLAETVVWRTGMLSPYAATAVLAFIAFFFAQLSFAASSHRQAKIASAVAFVSAGLALAASGHASAASPQFLMRPAVFVHALGIAFWVGALLPLAGHLLERPRDTHAALHRFSRMAPFVVAALIVSGTTLAVVQVEEVSALWRTGYGRLLLAKLALLSLLFALALYNRFRLMPRALAGGPESARSLARSIGVELVLALAIFSLAATWRFTPPPRALAALAAAPATLHIHSQRALAEIRFDPGRTGPTTASIVVMTGEYGPLDVREVQLALSRPDSGIEPIRRPAEKDADGVWRVRRLLVPQPGRWTVRVDLLISDFEKVTLEDSVEFRP